MNKELKKEQELSKYLEDWIRAKYSDWASLEHEISQNKRNGIYRLKNGEKMMQMLINVTGNIEEHFAWDKGQHLIPAQFPSVKVALETLERFDKLMWTDYQKYVIPNYNGDNTPIEVSEIGKICIEIHNVVKRCKKVYGIQTEQTMVNNRFSTEIGTVFKTSYVKVFFLDDADAARTKPTLEALNCVKKANITESQSKDHPGQTLTVYPKSMIDVKTCENEVTDTLVLFFSNVTIGKMNGHNEAYFASIEKQILEALDQAEATIDVCVAWFTNEKLRDKLLEKKKEDVKVRVIIYKDSINCSKGVDLTDLSYKEYKGERGGIMHDKFCVIDNVSTINGSYNWTLNAENKNDEDVAFHVEDHKFASQFTKKFNQMWDREGNED